VKVAWIFDVISPFAYLGLKQMHELPAHVELEYVPVLLAGLLEHHGQLGPAEMPTKRRFTYRFAVWRSRRMGIKMRMPPQHPFNSLAAQRLIIAAGCTAPAVELVFDAIFHEGLDAADPKVIERLGAELGMKDPMAASGEPAVKQALRRNTEWAIGQGIFGVPTFLVGEEIFWGHDAFEMLLGYIRDPAAFDDPEMRALDTLPIGARRPGASRPS
jgi:2-hydroxychromene-2-carboxylate isomerase